MQLPSTKLCSIWCTQRFTKWLINWLPRMKTPQSVDFCREQFFLIILLYSKLISWLLSFARQANEQQVGCEAVMAAVSGVLIHRVIMVMLMPRRHSWCTYRMCSKYTAAVIFMDYVFSPSGSAPHKLHLRWTSAWEEQRHEIPLKICLLSALERK